MTEIKTGMTALSMAGHDTGRYYMVVKADKDCVYLADGRLRTLERLKKKKMKHVRLNCHISPEIKEILETGGELNNEIIKRVLKKNRGKQEV